MNFRNQMTQHLENDQGKGGRGGDSNINGVNGSSNNYYLLNLLLC